MKKSQKNEAVDGFFVSQKKNSFNFMLKFDLDKNFFKKPKIFVILQMFCAFWIKNLIEFEKL